MINMSTDQNIRVSKLLSELTEIPSEILLTGIEKFGYVEIINNPSLLDINEEQVKKLTNIGLLVHAEVVIG